MKIDGCSLIMWPFMAIGTMILWNDFMTLFDIPPLAYWQALGLIAGLFLINKENWATGEMP